MGSLVTGDHSAARIKLKRVQIILWMARKGVILKRVHMIFQDLWIANLIGKRISTKY